LSFFHLLASYVFLLLLKRSEMNISFLHLYLTTT
jgi:hypothetical protein